jgi:hypothetical protein
MESNKKVVKNMWGTREPIIRTELEIVRERCDYLNRGVIKNYIKSLEREPLNIYSYYSDIEQYKRMVKLAKEHDITINSFDLKMYNRAVKLAKQHGQFSGGRIRMD